MLKCGDIAEVKTKNLSSCSWDARQQ